MFVTETLNIQEFPVREAPMIQLIGFSKSSITSHEIYVQTPKEKVKQFLRSRVTKVGFEILLDAMFI